MKILHVRFKNLNSLVGEWKINLTDPAFLSDGIFAIIGPTGAGKTTILDAICLGLYGRTPRLNRVTKNSNEVMSRRTGECFAEVVFETHSGRYCCHWSQQRARKRPDGELQPPKHEFSNADTGEVFETKIRGVAVQIEATTGMDFDRFTRSMLLAQGGFAAFLQASPDDRAPILEQITGTEIYSQISIRVHERKQHERAQLNLLEAETKGIVILAPEEEKELEQALDAKQKEETELVTKTAEASEAIAWLTMIAALNNEIRSLDEEANKLRIDMAAFQPDREKLDRAKRAAALDGTYATLTTTHKQQEDDKAALKARQEAVPQLQSAAQDQAKVLQSAELHCKQAKIELLEAAPTLKKVRSLDQKLSTHKQAVSEGEKDCAKDAAKIDADRNTLLGVRQDRAKAFETLRAVKVFLATHKQDEWLVSGLGGVEERLEGLLSTQRELVEQEAARQTMQQAVQLAEKSLYECQRQTEIRKKKLQEASQRMQKEIDTLSKLLAGRLLREYRAEKDAVLREREYLTRIAALEDHRVRLKDGEACPLCGAIEHPFAQGNVPVPDKTAEKIDDLNNLIAQAEDKEAAIKKLEEAESKAREQLTEAQKLELTAASEKTLADRALAAASEGFTNRQTDFAQRRQGVFASLSPLGIVDAPDTDISSLIASLRERLEAWQDKVKKKEAIEKQVAEIDSNIERLEAVIATQNTALDEKRKRLDDVITQFAAASAERNAVYGNKNPDNEERSLNEAVSDAERAEKKARERHTELQRKWITANAQLEDIIKRIDTRETELAWLEKEFCAALGLEGFADKTQFLAARLSPQARAKLTDTAQALDDRQTDLKARQQDRQRRLAVETERKITDKSLQELELRHKEYEHGLEELRNAIAGLKHKLTENTAAIERVKYKQTAIEAQRKECGRWDRLHELIGSADGKKYRNFAQGLTFDIMVVYANRQLQKMTDRYLLIRDQNQPLELNVVDNYQAEEIRSTKNLSGGESFLVSLSLALGLSHMASKNVRVDSLFLDEGFGTLDEEVLDTALETLAGLRREGKLIGVISHVPALKERIGAQIEVVPKTGGRSELFGPGCSRSGDWL